MAAAAAAAAVAAGGTGLGLFSYNRGNYRMDQRSHFHRYAAGVNMAVAQTRMYREDIADLTNLTVSRQECYHGVAALGLVALTAIFCSGRLGLHTAPPPGWLAGLELVNVAGGYLFMGLTLWLSMHASMRADTAATHLLTRFVRLPVPSQGMLDRARKFLSSFEEQPLREIFRVPFTRHARGGGGGGACCDDDVDMDRKAKRRSRHGFDVPAWYRKERAIDCLGAIDSIESMMPLAARGSAPEHFEAYRELQMEWFPYDVYARVSLFLAFMHLSYGWCYMQIGHHLQETRAAFACATVVLPLFVLQQIILTLDIIPSGPPVHRLGPCALWFAYVAAAIEYKRWYTPGAQALGFLLVYCAYAAHAGCTLHFIRLCAPCRAAPAVAEAPGASWWPAEWRLPLAFHHAVWLVAPPRHLAEGQHDIAGELRAAAAAPAGTGHNGADTPAATLEQERRADVHRALGKQGESPAWFNVRAGLAALVLAWVFLMLGFTVEVINQGTGHPALLSAPGLPQHSRDPRYRPPKPGASEPPVVGTGGVEAGPARGMMRAPPPRRLDSDSDRPAPEPGRAELTRRLLELLPQLQALQEPLAWGRAREVEPASGGLPLLPAAPGRGPRGAASVVRWPALFEPRLLVCGPGDRLAALSPFGRGALLNASAATAAAEGPVAAAPFRLEGVGVAAHGRLAAASWNEAGLLLLTDSGATLECPGSGPASGTWRCARLAGPALPLATRASRGRAAGAGAAVAVVARGALPGRLGAAAAGGEGLLAALGAADEASVRLLARASGPESPWRLVGEVRSPSPRMVPASLTSGELVLVSASDGEVARIATEEGTASLLARAPDVEREDLASRRSWAAACRLAPSGRLARLGVATAGAARVEPKLLLD